MSFFRIELRASNNLYNISSNSGKNAEKMKLKSLRNSGWETAHHCIGIFRPCWNKVSHAMFQNRMPRS